LLCAETAEEAKWAKLYLRIFANGHRYFYSARIEMQGANFRAVSVMNTDTIDISLHTSNKVNECINIILIF